MANLSTHRISCHCCTLYLFIIVSVMIASTAMGQLIDDSQVNDQRVSKSTIISDIIFTRLPSDEIKTFPIPQGTKHVRLDTNHGAGSTAGASETLIYSSLLGKRIVQVPPFQLVADDLFVNAAPGCTLRRFTFQTIGMANPKGVGGAYEIQYALYDNCPGVGGNIISGTDGLITIPIEQESDIVTNTVTIPIEQSIILPCNVWLGFRTSRDNVGFIMGAPPTHGFSEDIVDFPGFACNANIGGFPNFGHATFNAEVFGDASCSAAFLGYKNEKAFKGGFSVGADILMADDIELGVEGCQMVAYEIGVRGPGLYTFELRRDAGGIPGSIIDGTQKLFIHNENTFHSECFSFTSLPITLENKFWVTFKVNNDVGGWVLTEHDASWGHTTESFAVQNDQGVWEIVDPAHDILNFGGFYFSAHCAGEQLLGACCDMYFTDDEGEAVCRDLPEMNCPFPPRDENLRPAWRQGESCRVCSHGINGGLPCSDIENCLGMFCDQDGTECNVDNDCSNGLCITATCEDNDPFVVTCGQAACCKPEGATGLRCENLTQNECIAVEPVENPREWQLGLLCGSQGQECPLSPCIGRTGDCTGGQNFQCQGGPLDGTTCISNEDCEGATCVCQPGCEQPMCCSDVCEIDSFCCETCWDNVCATIAESICFLDCNSNGIPDDEDIAGGTSPDVNGNGIPDECDDGSCCYPDGSCSVILESDCIEGIWTIDGSCVPNVCPLPSGACCDRSSGLGGVCTDQVISLDCQSEFETWSIDTLCSEISCEEVTGACCDVSSGLGGLCLDQVIQAECQGEQQSWFVETSCTEITCEEISGACCDVSSGLGGLCLDQVIQADCQGEQQSWVVETSCIDIICEEISGACCDRLDGICRNDLLKSECDGAQPMWNEGLSCSEILCDPAMGACCNPRFGTCTYTILADCVGEQFSWTKGAFCNDANCPDPFIPTVSQWGLMILTLLLLIAAKVYFNERNLQQATSK